MRKSKLVFFRVLFSLENPPSSDSFDESMFVPGEEYLFLPTEVPLSVIDVSGCGSPFLTRL